MGKGKYQKTRKSPLGLWCASAALVLTISCGIFFALTQKDNMDGSDARMEKEWPTKSSFAESEPVEVPPTSAAETNSPDSFVFQTEPSGVECPDMPTQLTCITVSGRSSWIINPRENGNFYGTFSSTDWGDQGPGYPGGTCYITQISGRFSAIEKIDAYSYRMVADSIEKTAQAGETYIADSVRYVAEEGTGIDNGDEFYLYLPGVPHSDLPQGLVESVNNSGYYSLEEIDRDSYILYNPNPEFSGYEFVFVGEIGVMPTNLPQSVDKYDLQPLTNFTLNGFWHSTDGRYVYSIYTTEYDSALTETLHCVDLKGSDEVKAGKVIQTSSYSIQLKAGENPETHFEVFAVDKKLTCDEITLVRTDDYTADRILGTWKNEDWSYTFEKDGTYTVERIGGKSYFGDYFVIDGTKVVLSEFSSESKLCDYRIDEVGLWINNMNVLHR